ncbi:MAG: hypothetical protein ACOCM0_09335 [Campylobacter hyointestinalis]
MDKLLLLIPWIVEKILDLINKVKGVSRLAILGFLIKVIDGFLIFGLVFVFTKIFELILMVIELFNSFNKKIQDSSNSSSIDINYAIDILSASGFWGAFVDFYNIVFPIFSSLFIIVLYILLFKLRKFILDEIKYITNFITEVKIEKSLTSGKFSSGKK